MLIILYSDPDCLGGVNSHCSDTEAWCDDGCKHCHVCCILCTFQQRYNLIEAEYGESRLVLFSSEPTASMDYCKMLECIMQIVLYDVMIFLISHAGATQRKRI